jgi:ATP-dependent DNA helicase DinG|tara:strand:+ start:2127 stop:4247 length:2121 start_codon:yes stop_codon:yes gene_type:complete
MLDEELKQTIQSAYSRLLEGKGYSARLCQRMMIAAIANTLGNLQTDDEEKPNLCVIEAGTGTGKTIAYALAAIPIAKALGKSLVISTATVALQEQIVYTDLPDIKRHSELEFSFTLAKGRRRYLCLSRLDSVLQESSSLSQNLAFYDDEVDQFSDEESRLLYQRLLDAAAQGQWDGDKDSWKESIADRDWYRISTDHVQCSGRRCMNYGNCFFYKARERIHKVDCIVTNHDLVLADLTIGGGAVLPDPAETLYIFDEGHHLPEKTIDHFSLFSNLRASQTWLQQMPPLLTALLAEMESLATWTERLDRFEDSVAELNRDLEVALGVLGEHFESVRESNRGVPAQYRFPGGRIAEPIRQLAVNLCAGFARLQGLLTALDADFEQILSDEEADDRDLAVEWHPTVAALLTRTQSNTLLWQDFSEEDQSELPPRARWLTLREYQGDREIQISSSPVLVDGILNQHLWERCFGAVITSATLAVRGDFSRFMQRSGVSADNNFNALPSPFDFSKQGEIRIPAMQCDPRDSDAHTRAIIEMLPELLSDQSGSLVLFASWWQMNEVLRELPEEFLRRVLAQGDLSKQEIIKQHRRQVDAGQSSVIFGLASFAEGIDLPGEYCDHVVIIKIPFSVPNDPVVATLCEWVDGRGGNSFREISVPDAILRLIQASGRLLRTEQDRGVVTLLDRRIVTQRYGEMILDSMPPYKRVIER